MVHVCACGCGQPRTLDVRGRIRGAFNRGHMFYALRRPLAERLWEKTDKAGSCWIWVGTTNRDGYGNIGIDNKKTALTHRVAWMVTHGPIPVDLCVLHRCDNPRCVNPDHLFLGTQADNMRDMMLKGRSRKGRRQVA